MNAATKNWLEGYSTVYSTEYEDTLQSVWDIETSIGLLWSTSVRDDFRHMWE